MAYHTEKTGKDTYDIVIDGFAKGIQGSPEMGIADIKCGNITTIPDEVSVNYARTSQNYSAIVGQTLSTTSGQTRMQYTAGNPMFAVGMWIKITAGGQGNITNNTYWYVSSVVLVGGSLYNIQLTSDFATTLITPNFTGTLTFSNVLMGTPVDYAIERYPSTAPTYRYFILDDLGYVWTSNNGVAGPITSSTTWNMLVNPGASGLSGIPSGIAVMASTDTTNVIQYSYLLVFGNGSNYIKLGTVPAFSNAWQSFTGAPLRYSQYVPHRAKVNTNGVCFICDGTNIARLFQNPQKTFDPTDATTYTYDDPALLIDPTDTATTLGFINNGIGGSVQVVIGGIKNTVYIWSGQPLDYSFTPLFLPENYTYQILSVNNFVILFPGSKGNIYICNGSTISPLMTVPDYIAGANTYVNEPYYTWGGVMYLRGRVWFSLQDSIVSGSTVTTTGNCGGIWSFVPQMSAFVEQDVGLALRLENQNSYGDYNGMATVLFAPQETTAQAVHGPQYVSAWNNGHGSAALNGIDWSSTSPYTGGTRIETDLIPTGTFLDKKSFAQVEYKLAAPLANGESVLVYYRINLSDPSGWTSLGSAVVETSNLMSGYYSVTFQNTQYLQFRIVLNAITNGSSFCRLTQLRLR